MIAGAAVRELLAHSFACAARVSMPPGSSRDSHVLGNVDGAPSLIAPSSAIVHATAAVSSEQPAPLTVTAVAMKGMVAADMTMGGDTVLAHLETFERHVLRGRWSLVTSDDSDHVFVAKDGSDEVNEPHDVEGVFARQLFEDDEGQRYQFRLRDAVQNPQPMAALMSRRRVGRTTLHVGTTSASVCFQVCVFIRPSPWKRACLLADAGRVLVLGDARV